MLDVADRCASVPETYNGYTDEDGCPDVVPPELDAIRGTIEGLLYAATRGFRQGALSQVFAFGGASIGLVAGALFAPEIANAFIHEPGPNLALVTLTYGAVAERTIFLFGPFTGGGSGAPAPKPQWAQSDNVYAYVCMGFLAFVLFIDWRFVKTKAGRAVQAVRDSERVAASMGISVMKYKLLAFIFMGFLAGLAGGQPRDLLGEARHRPIGALLQRQRRALVGHQKVRRVLARIQETLGIQGHHVADLGRALHRLHHRLDFHADGVAKFIARIDRPSAPVT